MIINHNITALNTHRQMGAATNAQANSMEKLSSGLRINSAKDDAAGLSISEKMRGQIRGLEQASKNAQDGISLMQTAEGALNETHDILQRMREVATQSGNGTLTDADRGALQDEMNQLTSEVNRIGNTTEFNTQGLLKGDGSMSLEKTGFITKATATGSANPTQAQATIDITTAATVNSTVSMEIGGEKFSFTFSADDATDITDAGDTAETNSLANAAIPGSPDAGEILAAATAKTQAELDATASKLNTAVNDFISKNDTLKGQFTSALSDSDTVTITAVAGKDFAGAKGAITPAQTTGGIVVDATAGLGITTNTAAVDNTALNFGGIAKSDGEVTPALDKEATTKAIEDLVGKGFEINGSKVEFYNVNDGAYKGDALGVDISKALDAVANVTGNAGDLATDSEIVQDAFTKAVADQIGDKVDGAKITAGADGALTVTSTATGPDAKLTISDGGVQEGFKTSFQIGANTGQSMSIEINDMRSQALGLTGKAGEAGFAATNNVTNGTDDVKTEASLDLSTKENSSKSIEVIDKAIASVSAERSKLGATQNRLDHTINNLNTSAENLTSAESRIRDVDYAKAA